MALVDTFNTCCNIIIIINSDKVNVVENSNVLLMK